jgi:hypothetical protein
MAQMRRVIFGWITVGTLVLSSGPAQAQTVSNGTYYPWPAWDQTLACSTTATCPRFIVLSNMNRAAVLDRETGLVWEESPVTPGVGWKNAQALCNNKTVGNRKGWRLPTIQELASLVDPSVLGLALPAGHPFSSAQAGPYWSATTSATDTSGSGSGDAWVVVFFSGGVVTTDHKPSPNLVWCVRGGQGVDPQ